MKKDPVFDPEKLKAVFIDLDGTLIDSMAVLYKVYLEFLGRFRISGSKADFRSVLGPSIREVVVLLKERYQLKPDYDELLKMYHSLLTPRYEKDVQLFSYAVEFLEFIERSPLKILLVTSATSLSANVIIDRLGIKKFFDFVVASDAVRLTKPDPEIYEKALEIAQVKPFEVIAIEDSPAGIKAALGAGIVPIWIQGREKISLKYRKDPVLIEASDWRVVLSLFKHWL